MEHPDPSVIPCLERLKQRLLLTADGSVPAGSFVPDEILIQADRCCT